MDNTILNIVDEAIRLELNLAKLYLNFHLKFPGDANFWWTLTLEEENHASLLRSARDHFIPKDVFPRDMLSSDIQPLIDTNERLERLIGEHRDAPPSRKNAFNVAIRFEQSAGESHYQYAMSLPRQSKVLAVFQELNNNDKNHIERLSAYMDTHGIG